MSQPRRLGLSSGVVVSVLLLGLAVPAAGQVRLSTVQEVVDRWKPETHLYVLGDVGLRDEALAEMEAWLEGRHWTVLLVQDAAGQQFKDEEGLIRSGEEAIEYGTGQGITRAPGFAGQVHPDTGEPDGAIFSIVIAQRALYYTGSEAQDSRGLGESAFVGVLDEWAISALRNGGGLVAAVEDTVTNVDARLAQAIGTEREQAASYLAWSRTRVSDAETEVGGLEKEAAALPGAARPDTGPLRQQIGRARALLDEEKAAEAIKLLESVFQEIQLLQANIYLYRSYTDRLAEHQARLDRLRSRNNPDDAAREEIRRASQLLAKARDQHGKGGLGAEQIDRAEAAVRSAEHAERRAEERKFFFAFVGLMLLGVLAWIAWGLNRRRLPVKQEAEALLASWQMALDRKLEALFGELEQRVERLIGPSEVRRFTGETGDLASQVRSDVGSLTLLWTSGRAVLEQAAEHIRPRRTGRVLYNFFFPGNYRRGLALLQDEPVPFDPAEGLPRLFGAERTWRGDLLGDLAAYEPFRKSFEELMEEFHTRAARAAGALDELETSQRELPLLAEKTHERIWQTGLQKDYLGEAGADGLFLVPAVFSELLPAATAALEAAQETADADPVGTRKGEAAQAERMAADAWRLAGLCRSVRSAVIPALQPSEIRLREAGFPTVWVGDGLRSFSTRAAELASRSAKEAVSAEIETLAADLAELPELAGRLAEARSWIVTEERRVELSRIEMGTALGLAPHLLLRETGSDPSERLASAASQAAETEARLGRSEVEPAAEALESANRLAGEAAAILAASRKTFEERETAVAERRAETERLTALLPEHEIVLAGTREAYAESALGTVGDNLEEAREEIAAARGKLDLAVSGIREGRMLAAASLLGEVRVHQEQAGSHLAEIMDTRARLDRAREENVGVLAELEARVGKTGPELTGDPRITQPTWAVFEEAAGRVRTARGWIDAGREDPLRAGQELLAARVGLDRVETTLAPEDRRLHDEAVRQIEEAGTRVGQADGWSGPYGVVIQGRPGATALETARALLGQQRYGDARESALAAWTEADSALSNALAVVARRRAQEEAEEEAEERRRDAARRAEESRRQSISSSSNSFSSRSSGSSGSSSGSSSSSSGSSRSSYGGSGSGSGKSGW